MPTIRQYGLLALVASVAMAARLHQLDFESFFMDEIHQAHSYAGGFGAALRGAIGQQQPPLDYFVGHLVYQINTSDFALRLPSALYGTGGAVMVSMLLIRALPGAPAVIPVGAGLLIAVLPYPVYISQDIRPYSSAIFYFLLQLLAIDNLFRRGSPGLADYLATGLTTLLFLLSRTLSPLVICLVQGLLLFVPWLMALPAEGIKNTAGQARRFFAQLSLSGAFLVYAPLLYSIVSSGERYLRAVDDRPGDWPIHQLTEVWTAQLEPFGWPHFLLFAVGWLSILRGGWCEHKLLCRLAVLLPVASVVHFTIFNSMTASAFRPPYSIYVLPAALMIAAVGLSLVMEQLKQRLGQPVFVLVAVAVTLSIAAPAMFASADFKQRRLKTDWRAFSREVSRAQGLPVLWVFHTLSNEQVWSPDFYGFFRYPVPPVEAYTLERMASQTDMAQRLQRVGHKPVLVLFAYRDYLLTSASTVPIHPAPEASPVGFDQLNLPAGVLQQHYNGLLLLSMRGRYENTGEELAALLNRILAGGARGPWLDPLRQFAHHIGQEQAQP